MIILEEDRRILHEADDTGSSRWEPVRHMWTRWNTHMAVQADPADVIDVLTCVHAIRCWSPVDFELDDMDVNRLHGGTHARVVGRLAGFGVGFDVEVHEASADRLALMARGPVELDVEYLVEQADTGSSVEAAVSVRSTGGTSGRIVARAVNTLLAAGALDRALARICSEAEASGELALAA
jgi:hypothetical protein